MNISRIFDVYSRKLLPVESPPKPLTTELRNRVIQLCLTTFPVNRLNIGLVSGLTEFWSELQEKLLYLHGLRSLSDVPTSDPTSEISTFLLRCRDDHFLDFIELIFQSELIWNVLDPRTGDRLDVHRLVDNFNTFLEVDELPYYLTGFNVSNDRIETYPQIIRRDSQSLHQTAIKPTLALLSYSTFTSANEEFLDALKDFRTGDYGDCVVKCGSSLESVMKIICDRKGWSYQQTDTAGTLLDSILPRTSLESYFKQPIMLIATIRNRLSKAHGAGTEQKVVPKHVANYVINATASAILLLVHETNP